jgi:hypothetical protein
MTLRATSISSLKVASGLSLVDGSVMEMHLKLCLS